VLSILWHERGRLRPYPRLAEAGAGSTGRRRRDQPQRRARRAARARPCGAPTLLGRRRAKHRSLRARPVAECGNHDTALAPGNRLIPAETD